MACICEGSQVLSKSGLPSPFEEETSYLILGSYSGPEQDGLLSPRVTLDTEIKASPHIIVDISSSRFRYECLENCEVLVEAMELEHDIDVINWITKSQDTQI